MHLEKQKFELHGKGYEYLCECDFSFLFFFLINWQKSQVNVLSHCHYGMLHLVIYNLCNIPDALHITAVLATTSVLKHITLAHKSTFYISLLLPLLSQWSIVVLILSLNLEPSLISFIYVMVDSHSNSIPA